MKNLLKSLILVCLAVAIALPLSAQEDKKKKKKDGKGQQSALANFVKQLSAKIELTDEQSAKIKALQEAAEPKLAEAGKVIGKKRGELAAARKKAIDDGKKGKEAQEAAEAAVGLTAEEKTALAKTQEISQGFQKAVAELLTADQKEKAGLNKKGGKKKKDA